MTRRTITVDANEAVASVAHRTNEVIAIYPITPSSPMGEFCDEWAAQGKKNLWGVIPTIAEMQSEAGAAGAIHGALQAGSLATTFTASQGLLLMIPNLYKIAGELTAFVIHVAARTLATHALSIFGDHSDVMACRQIGMGMLCSGSVQEAHDMALISQAASLKSRISFMHFFDGFRTSHEVNAMEELTDEDLLAMLDPKDIAAHRERALTPDRPVIRGTAQNPDVFFQAREAANPFYDACPAIVQSTMDQFAKLTGRAYKLFDYVGHPEAERVLILMGSGAEVAHETVEHLLAKGERVGILKVRLYRPFDASVFLAALPKTVKTISVLDRTKEPGAPGDPLYLDVITAMHEARVAGTLPFAAEPRVVAGRYGLSSKEFTPAMIKAAFDDLGAAKPRNHYTLGIVDDVTHLSMPYDATFDIEPKDVVRAVFYGLGSDGTVGSNKNSIKIIGEYTQNFAQGYFVYDSKKAGAVTISHLRFGPRPIRSSYLVSQANYVACHQTQFIEKLDLLEVAAPGAIFLANTQYGADEIWGHLPVELQEQIIAKKIRFYVIDAYKIAEESGLGRRTSTVLQTCFFALAEILPREKAIELIKKYTEKAYGKRGAQVVQQNFTAIDNTLAHLAQVKVPEATSTTRRRPPVVPTAAPDFVKRVSAVMLEGKGDLLPVSAFLPDGTWPLSTTQWERRSIALSIPTWDPKICIQCNKCTMVCPHAAIRANVFPANHLEGAPESFVAVDFKGNDYPGYKYSIQVAPEDCTGCELCAIVCPAKDKSNPKHKSLDMVPLHDQKEREMENWDFFKTLPVVDRRKVSLDVKGTQFLEPLFEFSGACAGCGETPYVKLLTQLFGDRALIGNATGCSSIYGGNLPTTPYKTDAHGHGPAWSNSLFEDTAEFGMGFRLAVDAQNHLAAAILTSFASSVGDELVGALLAANQDDEAGILAQRERVKILKEKLAKIEGLPARRLELVADYLVRKSVWILGGDGWAYDIGYGGLDHVMASTQDVNILVLDTEVYSNTGGQQSKATPIGAAAKFAAAGKETGKKDLGLIAMSYGTAYVARVAFGARDLQTVNAFREAESYRGPSIIIAYSHCIAHGYDMTKGLEQQKLAVDSGIWPLYRYDPRRAERGESPLKLDSGAPKTKVRDYMKNEGRFLMVERMNPTRYAGMVAQAERNVASRIELYQQLAAVKGVASEAHTEAKPAGNGTAATTKEG